MMKVECFGCSIDFPVDEIVHTFVEERQNLHLCHDCRPLYSVCRNACFKPDPVSFQIRSFDYCLSCAAEKLYRMFQ